MNLTKEITISHTTKSSTGEEIAKEWTFEVNFPNIGQLIEIESKKYAYKADIFNTSTLDGAQAYNFASMVATFSVLIPDLLKNLNISSYNEMNLFEAKNILKAYVEQFMPWYSELMIELNKTDKDE